METLKKIAKEWGIFLGIAVIVLVLGGYHALRPTDYKTVNESKVVSMLKGNDDFVLVVGTQTKPEDSSATDYTGATSEQNIYVKQFIKDKHQTVYYLNADELKDASAFLKDNFGSESATLPQTFFVVNGEVYRSREGTVKYYEFSKLVSDWKDKK